MSDKLIPAFIPIDHKSHKGDLSHTDDLVFGRLT